MSAASPPVTAADVAAVMDDALTVLLDRLDRDWQQQAGTLDWTCWETIEHTSDSLLFYATQLVPLREPMPTGYAFEYRGKRPGGPEGIIFAQAELGPAGLLRTFSACGGLLTSAISTAPPDHRGRHMWGASDAAGFAAMGIVELAAHVFDVADALEVDWRPADDLCDRVLGRLWPDTPGDTDRWETLLWATGRAELPGRPCQDEWRWYSEVR